MKPILLNLPMPIKTPRLIIKPPEIGDGVALNQAVLESFSTLHQFMDWAKVRPTIDDSEERVRLAAANWILKKSEDPWLMLLIFDISSGELIGSTDFHYIDWEIPSFEIGYWIRDARSGKGLMTEAINAMTQYAFQQLSAKRVAIICDVCNTKSRKIAERLGYILEGTLKSSRKNPSNNQISDSLIFAKYNLDDLPI